jgi:hypothetical protein
MTNVTTTNTTTTQTNTEILDGLILEYENTLTRLVDTGSSIQINRVVKPEDGTEKSKFKDIHNRIKDIVETDFPKTRSSNELIETIQELKLVAATDEEEQKLEVINSKFPDGPTTNECPYDKSILDTLFSNNASFQKVITTSKYGVSSNVMNDINEFVTSLYYSKVGNGRYAYDNIRELLVVGEGTTQNRLRNDVRNWDARYTRKVDVLRNYQIAMGLLNIPHRITYPCDTEFSVEYINFLDTSLLLRNLASTQDDLKKMNEKITAYEKSISISVNDFLELFPLLSKVIEDGISYSNKLVRKIVKVEVTKTYEMVIDVTDEGDIETEISAFMKDKGEMGNIGYKTSKGDLITEVSSKFGSVSLLEVTDYEEETKMVA